MNTRRFLQFYDSIYLWQYGDASCAPINLILETSFTKMRWLWEVIKTNRKVLYTSAYYLHAFTLCFFPSLFSLAINKQYSYWNTRVFQFVFRGKRCSTLFVQHQQIWPYTKTGYLLQTRVKPSLEIRWTGATSVLLNKDRHFSYPQDGYMPCSPPLIL